MVTGRQAPNAPNVNERLSVLAARYAHRLLEVLGPRLVSVVLFGSVARGEARADSDIDLLVVATDLPAGRFARLAVLEPVDQEFEQDLEALRRLGIDSRFAQIIKTPSEATRTRPLYLDMVEDARLLYDRDGFFRSVLDRLRETMKRLGSERRQRGTIRYWVLKPGMKFGEIIEL